MRWRTALWGAALLFGALFALQGGMVSTSEYLGLQDDVVALRDSLEVLRGLVEEERERLSLLDSDPRTQEREARRRYGVLRPGERLYLVVSGE